jgi:hypothetical protein
MIDEQRRLTSLAFDEFSDFVCMVDVTIVENEDAARPGIGIGQGNLALDKLKEQAKISERLTTNLERNTMNRSEVTEPWMMS